MKLIKNNIENGSQSAQGRLELKRYVEEGKIPTLLKAIKAKCYDCTGGFSDGREDCLIPLCPLYPYMPYNPNKSKVRTGKKLTDEQKQKMRNGAEKALKNKK